jgi:hypothetical protein
MSLFPVRFDSDTRAPLSAYAKSAIAATVGVALGLLATHLTTDKEYVFGAARSGPWTAWPKAGAFDADPYTRAVIARQANVPLGNGEGIVFVAHDDSGGAPLNGACDYAIEGATPIARLWTLAVYAPDGRILTPGNSRSEITSTSILRSSSGATGIAVASSARAGNWLATLKGKPFSLALTLYDAAASPTQTSLEGLALPTIRKGECQ